MIYTIKQPKKDINTRPPLAFIDSVYFLNNSIDNLVKHLAENDFYHLNLINLCLVNII